MKELHLHIGLHADHVGDLQTDGDHWEEWGEARPAGEAVHVTVEVDDLEDALGRLVGVVKGGRELVPMHEDGQQGVVAVVTPTNEWSEPLMEVRLFL